MRTACSTLALGLLALTAAGQDMEAFFAGRAPLVLDPSRGGFDPGGQVSLIHQDQWLQVPGTWRAAHLTAQWSIRNARKQVNAWFGVGLAALNEKHGIPGSHHASAGLMPAVHLRSGRRSFLSAGMELRWTNDRMGEGGAWGSQYDGLRYDAGLPSGEPGGATDHSWAEARVGVSWTLKRDVESAHRRERNLLVVGMAADHLGRLLLRESGGPPPALPIRATTYILGELPHEIWENGFFSGDLIGHVQGTAFTGRINVYAGKHLDNTMRSEGGPMRLGFKAGLGYRVQDALLVNAALDVGRTTVGLAYGWAVWPHNSLVAGRRSFELLVQLRSI
jgi:hypothetical protein